MAIQMRRGAYAEFDPLKMKAGEWAVSTDSDTKKQQIWMCFAPGIVKRMGTVEDFNTEIQRLIQNYLDGMAESVEKAQESAELATSKAQESAVSASNAKASETKAKASETNAKTSETNSAKSESEAQKYAEQAKEISESLSGALRPLGTINFADLPSTADANSGDMYNITGQFTTTTDFKEGAGNIIPAGSNVYLTIDRYWDVLAGTPVTGVKGAKEAYYRRGNVNITPTNIGAVAEDGNISDTTVTFADATTRANLVSGEKVSTGFRKIKKWFADLKSFAFKDLANNLTTTTTGSALDASQGKILKDKYDELNQSLSFKVNTTDSRLSDARTPKPHTHDDRYYTESEINTKLNALVKNHIVVSHMSELITVTGNSDREYSFSFSLPSDAEIIAQVPIIYAGGKGISIGRNVNKDFTVLLWNNNSSTQNVGVIYYVVYII